MARRDYLPINDEALRAWTLNFNNILALMPAKYGLSDEQMTTYTDLQADYTAKLAAAVNPMTRGNRTVFEKQEAKKSLIATTRLYAKQINGLMRITNDQRQALGLTIRDTTPTSIEPPTVAPYVRITGVWDGIISLELRQDGGLRAKPTGVADALLFTHVGEAPPATAQEWVYAATVGKTNVKLPYPAGADGKTVWIAAFWTNAKGMSGPSSRPASVNLPAIVAGPTQATQQPELRIAA